MLLELDGETTRIYAGLRMRVKLVRALGVRKAWRVARLVKQALTRQVPSAERRQFLKAVGRWAIVFGAMWLSPLAMEKVASAKDRKPNEPGPHARGRGRDTENGSSALAPPFLDFT